MSRRLTYTRHVSQRNSDRKVRKLPIYDSDKTESDRDVAFFTTPCPRVIENISYSSVKGHIELFGELILETRSVSEPIPKTKFAIRTPASKRKKKPAKELVMTSPFKREKRTFIPTPRMIKVMKESLAELYSIMGLNQSASNDSLNISGVQRLPDSPESSTKKSDADSTNIENSKKSTILEGKLKIFLV